MSSMVAGQPLTGSSGRDLGPAGVTGPPGSGCGRFVNDGWSQSFSMWLRVMPTVGSVLSC